MTKTDLVNFITEETGLTRADAMCALEAVMKGIVKGLKKEEKVALTGFATFTAKKKAAAVRRNPRTGEPVKTPAHIAVTFKAGSKLKEALN